MSRAGNMKTVLIITSIIIVLTGLFMAGIYAFITYKLKTKNRKQIIAENIEINSVWLEISFEKPLEPNKQVQKILLAIENFEDRHDDFFSIMIKLQDGTIINPEIEIVDETGKTYRLKVASIHGNAVGFSPNENLHGTYKFPKDAVYKTVRIRSDNPFFCKMIYWYDYDLK
jgi:hypothetical protein